MKYPIAFLLLFCFFVTHGQDNISFKHLNVENGLSQSSVLSISQDAKGFLWFGTRLGLNKYDSRNFRIYKHDNKDKYSLSDSEYISSILSAKDGSLWIGTPGGLNKYKEDLDNFDRILQKKNDPGTISSSKINCIFQDKKNRIWVGTGNGLNLLISKKNYRFKQFLSSQKIAQQVYTIAEDHNGTIWLGTTSGLMNIHLEGGKFVFKYFRTFSDKLNQANDNHVTSMVEDHNNNLWIGTKQTGLNKLNLNTGTITEYKYSSLDKNGINSDNIRKIIIDSQERLWIGTLHGINIYNTKNETFSTIQNDPENAESLSQNSVYDIFQDQQGIIWVGTYYGGINMIYPNFTPFKIYRSSNGKNGLSSNVVSSITEDANHNLWIGTEAEGLNYFDRTTNNYVHYKYNPNNAKSLSSNLVKSIFRDKTNHIWIGTHLGGLNQFLPKNKNFIRYTSKQNDTSSISSDEITTVFQDSHARFWVGTTNGLNLFNPSSGKFSRNKINGFSDAVFYIFEDSKQNLWVATNSGLFLMRNGSNTFKDFYFDPKKSKALPYSDVSCITEDKQGNLWIGTFQSGVYKIAPHEKTYSNILKENGLPSNSIISILEDNDSCLWIATDNGLCKYNPKQESFKIYNIQDGLPGNEFNYKSVLKDSNGEFFFGGLNGLISFYPSKIQENKTVPLAVFTALKLFNKPVSLHDESGLLTNNIGNISSITFNSNQNVFAIDFTVLNFIKPEKNRYAYKLEGFEKNWNYVDLPSASYTNLSPGTYTLMVKGSNNDGFWTHPATLIIKVLPPLYKTWWAYLFYALVAASVLFVLVRYLLIRAVLTKEKEVNEHKLEFFTNISHEIRTPLTLIIGPLQKLIEDSKDDPVLNRDLQPIKNNADRLMNLVTELLDFRKAESGKMSLQISPGNIVKFCKEIYLAFQNLAIANNITYTFASECPEVEIYFDKIQLEKVLFNLLSNAFKFTQKKGIISLSITTEKNLVIIKICDNGKGIQLEAQANLFNNFYQANPGINIGTGLGLSLAKDITELHNGKIYFESTAETSLQPGFTCFMLVLKKGKAHFKKSDFISDYVYYDDLANYDLQLKKAPQTSDLSASARPDKSTKEKKPNILLVEDNIEVRKFIKNALSELYDIHESEDGALGGNTAIELIPDLILSDVMMPNMDGLELCRKLKTDERTSHIPVILLTARSAYVHQVSGFENGADAYIMKPFNLKLLKLNIYNLLNARDILKRKFAQVVILEPKNLVINVTEQNFLNKIIQIIETHIADSEFGVPVLASEIGMSQPVLYKKIRALTDLSVNDFIKSLRLKKAAQLFKLKKCDVAEVAYSVGFNDRKYFSIEFKKQFGKSPSEFIKMEQLDRP